MHQTKYFYILDSRAKKTLNKHEKNEISKKEN